jgi:hypothetical protein
MLIFQVYMLTFEIYMLTFLTYMLTFGHGIHTSIRSYQKISITFFMITLSKIFSRHHSPKVFIFVTACKRSVRKTRLSSTAA